MSIKYKLVLSYIAMLLVPLVVSVFSVIWIVRGYENAYNFNLYKNSFDRGNSIFSKIIHTSIMNPDKMDETYLEKVDSQLSKVNSGIILRRNLDIIYSSDMFDQDSVLYNLPAYGSERNAPKKGRTLLGTSLILQQHDFRYFNGDKGTLFLLTDIEDRDKIIFKIVATSVVAILVILILTDGFLTFIMSRSIVTPIEKLKRASEKIKLGDLDFNVMSTSADEIGELTRSFEEMRSKLKKSIDVQHDYEKNRKELISNISHDLKTPMTAIKGYVEGIKDGVADTPEKLDKYIQVIYTKVSDMDKLVNELFLFSKLDLKSIPFNFEKINISSYLDDCFDELKFDMNKKGIQFKYRNMCSDGVCIKGDREKIKRVIINIVQNAVKYMNKKNGCISMYVTEQEKFVTIEIRDNGQGISKDALPYVFERFYRADPSRNSSTGGSGLGLAIAKRIIEDHGGQIWVKSKLHEGTSMFFTLKRYEVGDIIEKDIDY